MSSISSEQEVAPKLKDIKIYGAKKMRVEEITDNQTELTPNQEIVAKHLRLRHYIQKKEMTDEEGKKWLMDILREIINKGCRDDPSVLLREPCPTFREYLQDLALQLFRRKKLNDYFMNKNEIELIGEPIAEPEVVAPITPVSTTTPIDLSKYSITITVPRSSLLRLVSSTPTIQDIAEREIDNDMSQLLKKLYESLGYSTKSTNLLLLSNNIENEMIKFLNQLKLASK
jgi:hypothetical protein